MNVAPKTVTKYYGMDEENGLAYYQSAEESPMQRAVYKIGVNGKSKQQLTKKEGWNSASFSKGFKYYINYHSTANIIVFYTVMS